MKKYLVGGAVRDELLGRVPHERDWVVVGAAVEDMISQGFKPVGKDFPVFLHPTTHEEYALARTERKTAKGYKGFEFYTDSSVSLEQDLLRRDLTINAIAKDENGNLIDPFGGQKDLKDKVLRHVSEAFAEDPVRILRIARFAAKFPDFTVAPETHALIQRMVETGEVDALVPERVWQELSRGLAESAPYRFFEILKETDALKTIFPEIFALFGVPNPAEFHPEIDSGIHTLMALKKAAELTTDPVIRFAVLTHDFGKALTPRDEWPRHIGHEENGVAVVRQFCARLHAPKEFTELAMLVCQYHIRAGIILEMTAQAILRLLKAIDVFRRPERLEKFMIACQSDFQGRKSFENEPYPQKEYLQKAYEACKAVSVQEILEKHSQQDVSGDVIAQWIHQAQINALKRFLYARNNYKLKSSSL